MKRSVYFSAAVLGEIRAEARRQGRSLSALVQEAWRLARQRLHSIPDFRRAP